MLSKSRKLKPDLTHSKGEDDAFDDNAEAVYSLQRMKLGSQDIDSAMFALVLVAQETTRNS